MEYAFSWGETDSKKHLKQYMVCSIVVSYMEESKCWKGAVEDRGEGTWKNVSGPWWVKALQFFV